MPPPLRVVADDLSGAAECAAVIAQALRGATPVVLHGPLPAAGSWVLDTDSRAMPAAEAADVTVAALERTLALAPAGEPPCLKIDSTLRGHFPQQLAAALARPGLLQAVVICPALPTQGRSLHGGVLHVRGQAQRDASGQPVDLPRMLRAVGLQPVLLQPGASASVMELSSQLAQALAAGARAIVVDATEPRELQRLAEALAALPPQGPLLAVGAAGLVQALATQRLRGAEAPAPLPRPAAGPLVVMVGSFAAASTAQVDELAQQPDVHVARLDAPGWLSQPQVAREAVQTAQAQAARGDSVVLGVSGATPVASSRGLVRCMATAAQPLLDPAAVLVLTGGDTARVVLELLGVQQLEVLGELEPGICLSREPGGTRWIVTKAGGFGDRGALVRVLRHFRAAPPPAGPAE